MFLKVHRTNLDPIFIKYLISLLLKQNNSYQDEINYRLYFFSKFIVFIQCLYETYFGCQSND